MTRLSNNQLDVSLIGSTSSSHWVHEHKRKREDIIELGRKHFPQYSWTSERSVTDKLAHFAIKYVKMTVSGFFMIACGQTKYTHHDLGTSFSGRCLVELYRSISFLCVQGSLVLKIPFMWKLKLLYCCRILKLYRSYVYDFTTTLLLEVIVTNLHHFKFTVGIKTSQASWRKWSNTQDNRGETSPVF